MTEAVKILLLCVIGIQFGVLKHFGTEKYVWKLDKIQKYLWILSIFFVWVFGAENFILLLLSDLFNFSNKITKTIKLRMKIQHFFVAHQKFSKVIHGQSIFV